MTKIQNNLEIRKLEFVSSLHGFKVIWSTGIFLFVLCALSFMTVSPARAQVFSLVPSSSTNSVGNEFTIDLNIDTQSQAATSADVKLTFDSAILDVVKVANGTFFSDMANYIGAGKVFIGGFFQGQSAGKTGSGKLATLTLKGKSNGTAQLAFVCSTTKDDSNIFDSAGNDIIKCAGIKDGSYTITGGTTLPSSTPTASAASTLTSTLTPTGPQLTPTPPQSGMFAPTILFGGIGILLTIFGIALIF